MTRLPYWLALCFALVVAIPLTPHQVTTPAQAQSTGPTLIRQVNVPGIRDTKYPDVLGVGNTAYIVMSSGSTDNRSSVLSTITQPFATSEFVGPTTLGDATGQSDYSPSVAAVGADGAIYVAWMRSSSKELKMRRKGPNDADFGPERTVVGGGSFRVRPDIAVTSDGKIMVVWDENSRYRFRISTDGGANWTGTQLVSDDSTASRPYIAADSAGGIWIAYGTSGDTGAGHIKAGYWRGDTFSMKDLTPDKTDADYFADPSITVQPDNTPNVAWRNIPGGIYYAVRDAATGNWNRAKLVGGKATSYGTVAIASDREGNLHMAWGGDTSGAFDVWYAFKPKDQAWQGPLRASNDSDLDANFNISTTVSDFSYGHIVGERFTSGGLTTRYSAVQAQSIGCVGTLALTASTTVGTSKVTTTSPLTGVVTPSNCTPTQMQVTLNTPPTESTPKVAYNANVSIAVPANLIGTQCTQTVYTHLYKDANSTFSPSLITSDKILLDPPGDVDAAVQAINPYISGLSTTFTPFAGDAGTATGASGGDPAWTRSLTFYLSIQPDGDCTGLKSYTVGGGTSTTLTNQTFNGTLPFPIPVSTAPGLKTFDVNITDTIGNLKAFTRSLTYDPLQDPTQTIPNELGRPIVVAATLANDNATSGATKTIIRTLSFSGVNVTDNLYPAQNGPGTQFWGLWVANGALNDLNPDPTKLLWVPVKVTSPNATFSVQWNLFNNYTGNLPLTGRAGKYVVFTKFLDGAGNPSTKTFSTTMTLDPGYSVPTLSLPIVAKP
jgi:hypothetical protein